MAWEPDLIEDGDAATAASVNDRLDSYSTWVSALGRAAFRRGCFGMEHGGSVFERSLAPLILSSEGQHQRYLYGTFGTSMAYSAFGADGGTETAGSYTGDRAVVGHPDCPGYTGARARHVLNSGTGYKIGMDSGDRIEALLCLFNCQVFNIDDGANVRNMEVMLCLQIQIDGTWWTLDGTESFVSVDDHKLDPTSTNEPLDIDVPIATLVSELTISELGYGPDDPVTGVRAMVSLRGAVASTEVSLSRWSLSVLPLYAEMP